MAATKKGVWSLQEVRDKQLKSEWSYQASDPNSLYVWGSNQNGQLGLNAPDNSHYSSPVQIPGTWNGIYRTIDAESRFAEKTAGSLWTWGKNSNYGQLGVNDRTDRSSPTQIPGTTWNTLIAYEYGAVATKTDGTLWAWGSNTYGQVGQNDKTDRSSPCQIGTSTDWSTGFAQVSGTGCGAIKTNGTLWMWGRNWRGGLGQNGPLNAHYSSPIQVGTDTNWKTLYGDGLSFSAAKTDGTYWVWGRQWGGGLGLNQGGNNDNYSYSSPVQLGTNTNWAIVQNRTPQGLSTKTDGTLWSWGYQLRGTLGFNQSTTQYSSPTQLGTATDYPTADAKFMDVMNIPSLSGVIKTAGTLWLWGTNQYGQMAQNNTNSGISSPTQVPGTWAACDGKGWDGGVIAVT